MKRLDEMKSSSIVAGIWCGVLAIALSGAVGCVAVESANLEEGAFEPSMEEQAATTPAPVVSNELLSEYTAQGLAFAAEGQSVVQSHGSLNANGTSEKPPATQSYGYIGGEHQMAGGLLSCGNLSCNPNTGAGGTAYCRRVLQEPTAWCIKFSSSGLCCYP